MLADEYPEMDFLGPRVARRHAGAASTSTSRTSTPLAQRAVAAGAQAPAPGRRTSSTATARGTLEDPFGHMWHVATHIEDVTPKEMKKRAEKSMQAMS